MLDMWQPELARVHLRFSTALRWCAGLFALSWLLPVRVGGGQTYWSWTVFDRPSLYAGVLAPLVMAAVAFGLSQATKLDSLRKAAIAVVVLIVGSWCVASNPDTGEALFYGLPPQIRANGWVLTTALILAGAASAWAGGPRQGVRATQPAKVLAFAALGLMAVLLLWPTRGGLLLVTYARTASNLVNQTGFLVPKSSLAVNLALALLPLIVVQVVSLRALMGKGTRLGWTVALPPGLILLWAMKVATGGNDATFGVGLRVVVFFAGQIVLGIFAVHVALAQLLDIHVPESLAQTGLLRDALLAKALNAGTEPSKAAEGYRPWVARLVRERYESLSLVNKLSRTGEDIHPRMRLRLAGWLQEDVHRLTVEEVDEKLTRVKWPRGSKWVHWLAQGRRLEGVTASVVVLVGASAGVAQWLMVPKAPAWTLGPAPEWAKKLYGDDLPEIAIRAGRLEYEVRRKEFDEAVKQAVETALPVPELSRAIAELAKLAENPGPNRRAIARAGECVNEAARAAQLPFYVDPNVMGYFDRKGKPAYTFYVKTYTIEQVRVAHEGRASYEALWLERLDATNVAEQRLGWRKLGAPYAMVIQDTIREFWVESMLPALTGENRDVSLPEMQRLRDEVVQAIVESGMGLDEATAFVSEGLRCHQVPVAAYGDEGPSEESDRCTQRELDLQAKMVPVLARMVEGHELQHQIDGESLRPPDAVWRMMGSFADESVLRATNELSAYLSEIARAPRPRIALTHFQWVGTSGYGSPEFFAWQAAQPLLTNGLEDSSALTKLDSDALRQRAKNAYEGLFGAELPALNFESQAR